MELNLDRIPVIFNMIISFFPSELVISSLHGCRDLVILVLDIYA